VDVAVTSQLFFQNCLGGEKYVAAKKRDPGTLIATALTKHFKSMPLSDLIVATRTFPITSRVDLQRSLESIFANRFEPKLYGTHRDYGFTTLTFADFMNVDQRPVLKRRSLQDQAA
jgi:hypothetical protein